MAAYAVVVWRSGPLELAAALAAMETKLETLDSTTNALRLIGTEQVGPNIFEAYLVYNG